MTDEPHHALTAPCKSCPYRKDVPSGVWAEHEYEKLPAYDGEAVEQVINGATALFLCHQRNNALCSGWLGCHGPDNLIALRLHYQHVQPEVFDYETDVPLFTSGAEAAAHGMCDIETPTEAAHRTMNRLLRGNKGVPRDESD
jgi:hypothetical protein